MSFWVLSLSCKCYSGNGILPRKLLRKECRRDIRTGAECGLASAADPALPVSLIWLMDAFALNAVMQIIFLLREVYRGFSARSDRVVLPGGDKGLCRSTANLTFTRWDASKPATADNLVLLSKEEADVHDAATLQEIQLDEPEFVARVEALLDRVRREYYT